MHKNNFKKLLATLLLAVMLFNSKTTYTEATNYTLNTCTEEETPPIINPFPHH